MERRRLADISPTNKPYQTVFRLPQSLCKRPTSPCQPLSVGINKQPENPTPPLFSGCPMLLFLDFDGVLHSAYAFRQEQMFSQIPIFERFFRQPENAHIQFVISSTWRSGRDLATLRRPFSPDIAQRIIGKPPRTRRHQPHCHARTRNPVLPRQQPYPQRTVARPRRRAQLLPPPQPARVLLHRRHRANRTRPARTFATDSPRSKPLSGSLKRCCATPNPFNNPPQRNTP